MIKFKFKLKNYYKPTPKRMRKFGDALLGSCQFLTGFSVIMEEKWLAIACIIIGTIGKFLSNFYTEEEEPQDRGFT